MDSIRMVVTGRGPDGRSRVIEDRQIAPITVGSLPGYVWHRLWSQDRPPRAASDPDPADDPTHFPPPGGVRFYSFEVPPGEAVELDHDPAELEAALPGRAARMQAGQTGMHATDSLDLVMILAGEVTLELDDGSRTRLATGDAVVQQGAGHAWRNRGTGPCRMVVVVIGFAAA